MSTTLPFALTWTGVGIVSFAIPMLLFIVIAGTLYSIFLGTRKVPGHEVRALANTPGPAPPTAAVMDAAAPVEGGGAAPSPGPAEGSEDPEDAPSPPPESAG